MRERPVIRYTPQHLLLCLQVMELDDLSTPNTLRSPLYARKAGKRTVPRELVQSAPQPPLHLPDAGPWQTPPHSAASSECDVTEWSDVYMP